MATAPATWAGVPVRRRDGEWVGWRVVAAPPHPSPAAKAPVTARTWARAKPSRASSTAAWVGVSGSRVEVVVDAAADAAAASHPPFPPSRDGFSCRRGRAGWPQAVGLGGWGEPRCEAGPGPAAEAGECGEGGSGAAMPDAAAEAAGWKVEAAVGVLPGEQGDDAPLNKAATRRTAAATARGAPSTLRMTSASVAVAGRGRGEGFRASPPPPPALPTNPTTRTVAPVSALTLAARQARGPRADRAADAGTSRRTHARPPPPPPPPTPPPDGAAHADGSARSRATQASSAAAAGGGGGGGGGPPLPLPPVGVDGPSPEKEHWMTRSTAAAAAAAADAAWPPPPGAAVAGGCTFTRAPVAARTRATVSPPLPISVPTHRAGTRRR